MLLAVIQSNSWNSTVTVTLLSNSHPPTRVTGQVLSIWQWKYIENPTMQKRMEVLGFNKTLFVKQFQNKSSLPHFGSLAFPELNFSVDSCIPHPWCINFQTKRLIIFAKSFSQPRKTTRWNGTFCDLAEFARYMIDICSGCVPKTGCREPWYLNQYWHSTKDTVLLW